MRILIVHNTTIPAVKYGGIERVIWGLGKALNNLGHEVHYLVPKGSTCPFAKSVLVFNANEDINKQIPDYVDVVHLSYQVIEPITKPYITTFHGNVNQECKFDINTVFISANHAKRFHGNVFVYNGLDWSDYAKPVLDNSREYFHFLGDAAWKVKNVKGAIAIAKKANEKLVVLGGKRLNLNMGFRFTSDLHVRFKGMVGGDKKSALLQNSKGMIFPVLWHEPFGLAIIESMFYGCPVFGTAYGSLPELITKDTGFTSNSEGELIAAVKHAENFSKKDCHNYAADVFNADVMAKNYLRLYEKVLDGFTVHDSAPYLPSSEIINVKMLPMQH